MDSSAELLEKQEGLFSTAGDIYAWCQSGDSREEGLVSNTRLQPYTPITHKLTRAQEQRRVQKVYSQRETQVTKFNSLR